MAKTKTTIEIDGKQLLRLVSAFVRNTNECKDSLLISFSTGETDTVYSDAVKILEGIGFAAEIVEGKRGRKKIHGVVVGIKTNTKFGRQLAEIQKATEPAIPDSDGWFAWNGGEMPVAAETIVEVNHWHGKRSIGVAGGYSWQPECRGSDIKSYRLVTPPVPDPTINLV